MVQVAQMCKDIFKKKFFWRKTLILISEWWVKVKGNQSLARFGKALAMYLVIFSGVRSIKVAP